MQEIHVVAAIIEKDDKFLIAKRLKGEFKDLWEFPGGKVEPGESCERALIREIQEELNIHIEIQEFFINVLHKYPSFVLNMDCYICHMEDKKITLHDHSDIRWISLDSTDAISWVPADIKVIDAYKRRILND
ncbi:MAG: (deoxy)nucleoside triphosphate pyrophosphohydrolase [Anaerorhabdus sp.]|uniref:(deoxy)nucleoside triphosphate pyrophosphohydrolase n=1 Tax=Anaerorhabdus sp. TaxID=1872524 RepID=UPI003A860CB6